MDKKESRLYEFDRFCLDTSERILQYDMQEVPQRGYKFIVPVKVVNNMAEAGNGLPYHSVTTEATLRERYRECSAFKMVLHKLGMGKVED